MNPESVNLVVNVPNFVSREIPQAPPVKLFQPKELAPLLLAHARVAIKKSKHSGGHRPKKSRNR